MVTVSFCFELWKAGGGGGAAMMLLCRSTCMTAS